MKICVHNIIKFNWDYRKLYTCFEFLPFIFTNYNYNHNNISYL